jgi:hypothetical protein
MDHFLQRAERLSQLVAFCTNSYQLVAFVFWASHARNPIFAKISGTYGTRA